MSFFWDCAAAMIWSQVTGLVMSRPAAWATDLRYHSNCVFAHIGAPTSLSFQREDSTIGLTASATKVCSYCAGTGAK